MTTPAFLGRVNKICLFIIEHQSARLSLPPDDSMSSDFSDVSSFFEFRDAIPVYNVAVLGGSGVGKSTLINFINCMSVHGNIDEASKNPLPLLMPVKFHHQIPNPPGLVQVELKVPENTNERFNDANHAVTFEPMDYIVDFSDFKVRFIDTPGTNDSRGNDQDKMNVNNIVEHLISLPEIHGFLFVVKNNTSEGGSTFSNTMRQLLGILPPCALRNCFFVYTFTSMTPFNSGNAPYAFENVITKFQSDHDTSDLQLTADNQFFVNNIAFLELCAREAGYNERSTTLHQNTWDVSKDYVFRLLDQVKGIQPVFRCDIMITKEFIVMGELLRSLKAVKNDETDRLMATIAKGTMNGTAISFRKKTKYIRPLCSDEDWNRSKDYWLLNGFLIAHGIQKVRKLNKSNDDIAHCYTILDNAMSKLFVNCKNKK